MSATPRPAGLDPGPLADLIHATVHDAPQGVDGLAESLGIRPGTLQNKANPRQKGNSLSLQEAGELMSLTQDPRILRHLAAEMGYALVARPDNLRDTSDMDLLESHMAWHGDVSGATQAIRQALADRRIDREELTVIRTALAEATARGCELYNRLEAIADD